MADLGKVSEKSATNMKYILFIYHFGDRNNFPTNFQFGFTFSTLNKLLWVRVIVKVKVVKILFCMQPIQFPSLAPQMVP